MKTLLISAGHCNIKGANYDPGAVSGSFVEAELAVKMRDRVAAILRAAGFIVSEDGADGVSETLRKAIALARSADIAIEFHFNASASPKATGVESLALASKKALAQKLSQSISAATSLVLRGDKGFLDQSKGQHHRLGFCIAGGVIVELAFISNPQDMRAYTENFERIAGNIAQVLMEAAGGGVSASPVKSAENKTHAVAPGETLYTIARKNQTTVEALKAANNLSSNEIQPGQILIIKN